MRIVRRLQVDERRIAHGRRALALFRVERIAQAIADEVQAEQRHRHQYGRRHEQPRLVLHFLGAIRDQHAERGQRLVHAKAKEGEEAFRHDHDRDGQRHIDGHRADHVRQDVAADDRRARHTGGARSLDELLALDGERLAADDPAHGQPFDRADGGEDQDDVPAEDGQQKDDEEDVDAEIDEDDLEHVVDDLSDGEGDEEAGEMARKRLQKKEEKEQHQEMIRRMRDGFDGRRGGIATSAGARGTLRFDQLVAADGREGAKK